MKETLQRKVYFIYPKQIKKLSKIAKSLKKTPSEIIRQFISEL